MMWFDNIPKEGIICWVWNREQQNPKNNVALIYSYDTDTIYRYKGINNYISAVPVKPEELYNV